LGLANHTGMMILTLLTVNNC